MNYAESVGGAMELSVGGALAITVGGLMAETVGGVKSEAIGGNKTQAIGQRKSVDGRQNLTETISGEQTTTDHEGPDGNRRPASTVKK